MDSVFKIPSFQSGINEYYAEGLIKNYESIHAYNCNTSEGSLRTCNAPLTKHTLNSPIHSLMAFYDVSDSYLLCGCGNKLKKVDGTDVFDISGDKLDTLNFEYNGERILVATSKSDTPFLHSSKTTRKLKNRRKKYNEEGEHIGFIDADGKEHKDENTIETYAPKGEFMELHYDRLWIAGDKDNPDRVYFSTANVNGADIEDFTIPLAEEDEINMHGGFLDVRSYDGSKIIAMKVIFNSVVLFKNKSAYKIYGSSPSNYQLVDLFSCNGAIADKSICVGNNGAYFLNNDGIYYYDGTNTTLISQKIKNTIESMNKNYASKSVAIFKDSKYYIAIPTGDSETNNVLIEFNTINNSFMTYQIDDISSFLEYNNELLYTSGNHIKALFKGNSSLPLLWTTPTIDFGAKNSRKMSNYIYLRVKGQGKIKFTLITERKEKELLLDLPEKETLIRKKLKNKGRLFQLKIENVDNSSFTLVAPELHCELDED